MNTVVTHDHLPRVAWSAVFAGVCLSLVLYLVLTILGTAIGASALAPLSYQNPLHGFGIGTGIWILFTTVASVIAGAYFAGRSAPTQGWLHGLLSWSIMTLLSAYLLSSLVGGIVGAAFNVAGKGLEVAGQGVAAAAPEVGKAAKDQLQKSGVNVDMQGIQNQLQTLLTQTGKPALNPQSLKADVQQGASEGTQAASDAAAQPQQAGNDLNAWFDRVKQEGNTVLSAADKEALVNVIMARTGKSRPEAQQIADNYEQTYNQAMAKFAQTKQQAEQKAREAADAAAKGVARTTWWAFALMLVGAIVAAAAGNLGYRHQPPYDDDDLLARRVV